MVLAILLSVLSSSTGQSLQLSAIVSSLLSLLTSSPIDRLLKCFILPRRRRTMMVIVTLVRSIRSRAKFIHSKVASSSLVLLMTLSLF